MPASIEGAVEATGKPGRVITALLDIRPPASPLVSPWIRDARHPSFATPYGLLLHPQTQGQPQILSIVHFSRSTNTASSPSLPRVVFRIPNTSPRAISSLGTSHFSHSRNPDSLHRPSPFRRLMIVRNVPPSITSPVLDCCVAKFRFSIPNSVFDHGKRWLVSMSEDMIQGSGDFDGGSPHLV